MIALGAMAFGILVVLWFWARPLPWAGPPLELPTVYRFGIAVSLALAVGFLAIYLWMVSAEARDRARALVAGRRRRGWRQRRGSPRRASSASCRCASPRTSRRWC